MRASRATGVVFILLGLLVLFLLRGALWEFIVTVLQLIGIFVGFLLIVVGMAILGWGRMSRRVRWVSPPAST